MKTIKHLLLLTLFISMSACVAPGTIIEVRTVEDLGILEGGSESRAFDINQSGYIVGESDTGTGQFRAILISPDGSMTNLGVRDTGTMSSARGINDHNHIVGVANRSDSVIGEVEEGFFWSDGVFRALVPNLSSWPGGHPPPRNTIARKINNNDEVIGNSGFVSFIWSVDLLSDAAIPPESSVITPHGSWAPSQMYDINEAGGAVGFTTAQVGFYYIGRPRPRSYDYISGGAGYSVANAVDPIGRACGTEKFYNAETDRVDTHAVYWPSFDRMVDIGTLGGRNSWALDLNSSQYVVGYSETSDGNVHAFIWHETIGMVDLGTLGGANSRAFAINTNGDVVGESELPSGEMRAALWRIRYNP